MADTRVVYGAICVWWDTIDRVGKHPRAGIPCCPHCRGVLFEVPNENEWWDSVDQHERSGNPNYREFIEWLQGKCYPNMEAAEQAWRQDAVRKG